MAQTKPGKRWVTLQDGLDKLKLEDAQPPPSPGADEVLVEIKAVSLNYRDTEVAMGLYAHHRSMPSSQPALVPCSDACGIITAVGSSPTIPWKVGDRVLPTFNQTHLSGQITAKELGSGLGKPLGGVLQTYRLFPSTGLVKCPDYLTEEEGACLPIAAVTAWMAVNQFRPLGQPGGRGETVVCQGTGGVAVAGLQIAKASGAKVIITSSSDEKLAKAKSLGADHTINYKTTPEWQDEVMTFTGGEGADMILETGGAQTLEKSFACVKFGGTIACIGYVSGKEDAPGQRTNVNLLALQRNVTVKGILNGPRDRFEEMLRFYEEHGIRPPVDRVFGFGEAREALGYLYSGVHFGKVVVRVAE